MLENLIPPEFFKSIWLNWTIALMVLLLVFFGLLAFKSLFAKRLEGWSHRWATERLSLPLNLIKVIQGWVLFIVAANISASFVDLSLRTEKILHSILAFAILFQCALWGNKLIDFAIQEFLHHQKIRYGRENTSVLTIVPTTRFVGRIFLYSLLLLVGLANLGIDITALLAGLGVGGIAIALALQNILGDIFSSLSIVLDKPFEVGDSIVIGPANGPSGIVERIGLKTTRLRSGNGEQIIFSNSQLLSSQISNFKRMHERRVTLRLGLVYETDSALLKSVPQIIREAVEEEGAKVRFDRAHFVGFGASSLDFEAAFFIQSPDNTIMLDISQLIYFRLYETLKQKGIQFAYPTQTVFVRSEA